MPFVGAVEENATATTNSGSGMNDISVALFGNATEKNATGEKKKRKRLRLDFTPDSGKVVRARLRSGSGSNRNKKNGGVYVPLGRIEDVYNDDYYSEYHARCEQYAKRTGYQLVKKSSGIFEDSVASNNRR